MLAGLLFHLQILGRYDYFCIHVEIRLIRRIKCRDKAGSHTVSFFLLLELE
jgi:hypothetical protein